MKWNYLAGVVGLLLCACAPNNTTKTVSFEVFINGEVYDQQKPVQVILIGEGVRNIGSGDQQIAFSEQELKACESLLFVFDHFNLLFDAQAAKLIDRPFKLALNAVEDCFENEEECLEYNELDRECLLEYYLATKPIKENQTDGELPASLSTKKNVVYACP